MYVFSRDSYIGEASTGLELDENRETPEQGSLISKADTSDPGVLYDPTSVPKTTKCISG